MVRRVHFVTGFRFFELTDTSSCACNLSHILKTRAGAVLAHALLYYPLRELHAVLNTHAQSRADQEIKTRKTEVEEIL